MAGTARNGSDRNTAPRSFKIYKRLLITLLAIVVGTYQEFIDPFGLASLSDNFSAKIFTNLISPFYGRADQDSLVTVEEVDYFSHRNQGDILVVLIGDHYAPDWPIDPRRFIPLLRRLDRADAAATFLDIYFDDRDSDNTVSVDDLCAGGASVTPRQQKIERLLQHAGAMSMPVIFGELREHRLQTQRYDCEQQRWVPFDVHTALIEAHQQTGLYALQPEHDRPAAALKMYQLWCADNPQRCNSPGELPDSDRFAEDMFLYWGYAPNDLMTRNHFMGGGHCVVQSHNWSGKLGQSYQLLWRDVTRGLHEEQPGGCNGANCLCPYHTQIAISKLLQLTDSELRSLVADRMVLVGTALSKHPDWAYSPVQGYVPGVFYHAMALDNLMEFGADYIRPPDGDRGAAVESLALALILLLQAGMGLFIEFQQERDVDQLAVSRLNRTFAIFTVILVCSIVWYFSGCRLWAPTNWIGLATLLFLLSYDAGDDIPYHNWRMRLATRVLSWGDSSRAVGDHPRLAAFNALLGVLGFAAALVVLGHTLIVVPQALLLGAFQSFVSGYGVVVMAGFIAVLAALVYLMYRQYHNLSKP